MKEENKKEILTIENIKKEVKYQTTREILMATIIPLLILLIILIIKLLDSNLVTSGAISSDKAGLCFIIVLLSILFIMYLFIVIKNAGLMFNVCTNKYEIIKDRLVNLKNGVGPVPSTSITFYKPYRLWFSIKKRRYNIPSGKNYKWSKDYCMYDYNVFNSSSIGDEFYLIIVNDSIASAYNEKFFIYELPTNN